MSDSGQNPSGQAGSSTHGSSGQHSPSKDPTKVVPQRQRSSDLSDTIVLDQLRLAPGAREGSYGRIGTYEVLDIIGRGGMGVVLKAFDDTLHRDVAIKVISPTLVSAGNSRDRFLREARAAGGINHSNVVTIYAVGEHSGFPYLVMEFVHGQSLQQRIKSGVPLSELDVVRYSLQIACGLAAAHRHRIVHRDIKPGNVMLEDETRRVKITDFGLARTAFEGCEITSEGEVVGTPSFMSPEQVLGQPLDHRSDLFSLGCVMYAMFAGHSPFRSESPIASATKVHAEPHSSLRETCLEVPEYLVDIIDRLLEKRPQDRYESAQVVVDILSARLAKLSQDDCEETAAWMHQRGTKSRGNPSLTAGWQRVLVLCMIGLAAFLSFTWQPQRKAVPIPPVLPPPELPPRELTVGANGTGQYPTIQDALKHATPGCTIKVTDGGHYSGPIRIADSETLRGVKLIAAPQAVLSAPDIATCLTISGVAGFHLQGFRIDFGNAQHGLELRGFCPGTVVSNCGFHGLTHGRDDRAALHLQRGASGTEKAPLTIRRCRFQGGVGIVLGAHNDVQPVEFVRIEDCFIQGIGRDYGVGIVLQTAVRHTTISHNILRSGVCALNFVFKTPNAAENVEIRDNTLDLFEVAIGLSEVQPQQQIKIRSNLIIDTNGVRLGETPLPAFREWFEDNGWEHSATYHETQAKGVAELKSGVDLISRDPVSQDYLKPGPKAEPKLPGRYPVPAKK